MKRVELILIAVWVLAIALKLAHVPGSGIIFTVSSMSLAVIYAFTFRGYFSIFSDEVKIDEDELTTADFIGRLTSMAISVAIVGILFRFQMWPGASIMLLVGALALTATLLFSFTRLNSQYFKGILLRSLVYGVIAWSLYGIPKDTWYELRGIDPAQFEQYEEPTLEIEVE